MITVSKHELVAAALGMRGTPFQHQGRTPGVGLDCVGLIVCAARRCGINVHDARNYGIPPRSDVLLEELAVGAVPVNYEDRQAGDVLCFNQRPGQPAHFGMLLEASGYTADLMIHVSSIIGRVSIESVDRRWQRLLHGVWRLKEIG